MARSGMTLVEVLVTIAVIGILFGLLFPVFGKARKRARQGACISNQRQLAMQITMLASDNGDRLPNESELWGNFSEKFLRCGSDSANGNSYVYNTSLAGVGMGSIPDPVLTYLTADGQGAGTGNQTFMLRHFKRLVASFADGHAAAVDDPENP